jgi:hypothetical protein
MEMPKALWCARCKSEAYCCKECQKKDWKRHKEDCNKQKEAAAKKKEEAEQLLCKLRLAVEGPAAQGSVNPPQTSFNLNPFCPPDLPLTPESTAERIENLQKVAVGKVAVGGEAEEDWLGYKNEGAKVVVTFYDALFKELASLFNQEKYAEICARKAALVKAALSCYKPENAKLLWVASQIWHMLGQSLFKTMQYQDALKFFVRAYDAATHYSKFVQTDPNKKRPLQIVLSCIMKIIKIVLLQADLVSDTKRYTLQYVLPLLIQLDEPHQNLQKFDPASAASVAPEIWYLSAEACLNVKEFLQAAKYLQALTASVIVHY